MSKEINHWCVVCGKGYHACDACNKAPGFTPWRSLTDSAEHFKIFMILKNYNNGLLAGSEARQQLSALDLSGKDSFNESSRKVLADIFGESF